MIFDNMYQWILNAYNARFIAYVGELDGTYRKHINARLQLAKEGRFHFPGRVHQRAARRRDSQYDLLPGAEHTPRHGQRIS